MRPLVIDSVAKAEVKRVLDFALKPENLYDITKTETNLKIPGDNPQHVAQLNTFRCTFSITKASGGVFRHLSISVPSLHYPNPFAAYTIAELFGFTGWDQRSEALPNGWIANVNKDEHCIVLVQEKKD